MHILLLPDASIQPAQRHRVRLRTRQHHGHGKSCGTNTETGLLTKSSYNLLLHEFYTGCDTQTFCMKLNPGYVKPIITAGEGGVRRQSDRRPCLPVGCGDMGSSIILSGYVS